jgi:hypothetical protein
VGQTAICHSSSGNKFYNVTYDGVGKAIMCNDNASYYHGYLGYPAIAFLLATAVLPYEARLANLLQGVAWKDLNKQYKNDFTAALESVLIKLKREDRLALDTYAAALREAVTRLELTQLGQQTKPSALY